MSTNDYSLEELLKVVGEKSSKEEGPTDLVFHSSIGDFIKECSVTVGPDRVPNYHIFYVYKKKYGGELSKIEFFRQFKKEFKQVRTGKQRCYLLDGRAFELTREDEIEAEYLKNEQKEK